MLHGTRSMVRGGENWSQFQYEKNRPDGCAAALPFLMVLARVASQLFMPEGESEEIGEGACIGSCGRVGAKSVRLVLDE